MDFSETRAKINCVADLSRYHMKLADINAKWTEIDMHKTGCKEQEINKRWLEKKPLNCAWYKQ